MTDLIGEIMKADKRITSMRVTGYRCPLCQNKLHKEGDYLFYQHYSHLFPPRPIKFIDKRNEKCVWCGAVLKDWKECFQEEHAKDAVCNWKEQDVIGLLIEFACNYEPENPSVSDSSIRVRYYAERIARIIKEG